METTISQTNQDYYACATVDIQTCFKAKSREKAEEIADKIIGYIKLDSNYIHESLDYDGHEIIDTDLLGKIPGKRLNKYCVSARVEIQAYFKAEDYEDAENVAENILGDLNLNSSQTHDSIEYEGHEITEINLHE